MTLTMTLLLGMALLLAAGVCVVLLLRQSGRPLKLRWFLAGWAVLFLILLSWLAYSITQMQ